MYPLVALLVTSCLLMKGTIRRWQRTMMNQYRTQNKDKKETRRVWLCPFKRTSAMLLSVTIHRQSTTKMEKESQTSSRIQPLFLVPRRSLCAKAKLFCTVLSNVYLKSTSTLTLDRMSLVYGSLHFLCCVQCMAKPTQCVKENQARSVQSKQQLCTDTCCTLIPRPFAFIVTLKMEGWKGTGG